MSNPDRRRKTFRRAFAVGVIALAAALGFLLRGCLGLGLGEGDGERGDADTDAEIARPATSPDAAALPARCQLVLSSRGLTLNGRPSTVGDAVTTCAQARDVKLRVTGGARSGTYDELERAFDRAGIPLDVRDGRSN